jgi:hypothetical protein
VLEIFTWYRDLKYGKVSRAFFYNNGLLYGLKVEQNNQEIAPSVKNIQDLGPAVISQASAMDLTFRQSCTKQNGVDFGCFFLVNRRTHFSFQS